MKLNKIGDVGYLQVSNLDKAKALQGKHVWRGKEVREKPPTDKVNAKNLKRMLNELPDVRENRVNSLRKAISEGSYRVEAKQVATRMAQSMIFSRIWGR